MRATQEGEVVVTGLGPVTAIGVGREALWQALVAGQTAVATRSLPVDIGVNVELPVVSMPRDAEVPGLKPHLDYLATQDCAGYRDLAYTLLAIELALRDAGLTYDRDENRIGVIQAFEAPGVEVVVSRLLGMMSGPPPSDGPPRVYDLLAPSFYQTQSFFYVHVVGKAFGFHGLSGSVHNACSSGAFALEAAAQQIRAGQADVMLVAGGEAFDTAVRLEWFRRLELYSRDGVMRPFDAAASTGFYVGEGAGAMVLESAEHARRRGADVYGTYLGGGFAQQGWKQTIPDLRAGRLRGVIYAALERTGTAADAVHLIVPHGAATQLSDAYEASCLAGALGGAPAGAVAAWFKPAVGHMLGASGVIDTLCALLALKQQTVPPVPHGHPGASSLRVPVVAAATRRHLDVLLKISTGFTGHDAALVFRSA